MKVMAQRVAQDSLSAPTDADLRLMLLIRHAERKLLEFYEQGLLNGTTHTCLGQEYIPVVMRSLLDLRDFVFSTHRGHGHYLARYEDLHGLLAEIMGRHGAVCGGVGGSQHILRDRYLSTGVQGQSVPVATGVGLALKRSDPGRLACAYVGDGTWGEGVVYEALNMAALWSAPLVLVVEHNGIAQSTPTTMQMAGAIAARVRAFGIRHHRTESVDINVIRAEVGPLIQEVRGTCRPLVVEFVTHRLGPHSKGDDSRPAKEREHARRRDWCERYAKAFPEQFARCDASAREAVDRVAREVMALPPARWEDR